MLRGITLAAGFGIVFLLACHGSSPTYSSQQLEQKAAQATERLKQQSKEALKNARVAAGNAEQKVNAVASGVKQGMRSIPADGHGLIDINAASTADLAGLPGISLAKADEIAKHRPYRSTRQLVERGLLSEEQYAAISAKITVR